MEEESDQKWGREVTTNENLMKLIKLRREYEPIYNSSKGFKKQGWERISKELKMSKNANSCRKRFLDLTYKYRDIKEKLDSGYKKAECWPLFDEMKSILECEAASFREDLKSEKEKRTYYKWDDHSKVIELVERRRDYESIYRNSFGFSVSGWDKIAEDLKIGVCGTSCRKKFNLLLQNYRERSALKNASSNIKEKRKNIKTTETDIFNGLLKMVSKNKGNFHEIEVKLVNIISIDKSQFNWFDDRVIMLINLRKYYTETYNTLEGFAASGWEQISQEIGDGVSAENCRNKFEKLTEELENTTRNPNVAQSDEFYDQLINLILSDTNKHKMSDSSNYVCYESERAVDSISECYKENIGSIEEYYEVFEEDGNELKLSMMKDEIESKKSRPISMRQYFKWEANDNRNTHRMLELVVKYLKIYPDSKFKENKSISSKIWTAIANDFNNEVTPGSIRKKFSTVVQLYKANQCEIESNPDAEKIPFYDELNVIFEKTVDEYHDDYEASIDDEELESKISICEELIEEELENVLEDESTIEVIRNEEDKSETLKICTFCLRVFPGKSSEITFIYDETNKESSHILIEKINKVLFENKTEKFDHEISNMSCAPCLDNINACYSFKEQCLKSWNYVHEMKKSDQSNMEVTRDEIIKVQSKPIKKKKKQFPCPYECNKKFTKKTLLMKHIERHLLKKRIKTKFNYPCPVAPCQQLFPSDLSMRRHCIDVHRRFKPFSCHDCSATFFKKQSIDNHHIRKHQGNYQMEFLEEDIQHL